MAVPEPLPVTPETETGKANNNGKADVTEGVEKLPPPTSQGKSTERKRQMPEWMQDLPKLRFKPDAPDQNYQLISGEDLEKILREAKPEVAQQIQEDIKFLDNELLRLFRERDYEAKYQQSRYRVYQIAFIVLAALATLIGGLQALMVNRNPVWLLLLAFGETLVALFATFLATISGRESPLPLWLVNRRRAEQLRREYFRYLLTLPPYDSTKGFEKKQLLSRRAAAMYSGGFREEE